MKSRYIPFYNFFNKIILYNFVVNKSGKCITNRTFIVYKICVHYKIFLKKTKFGEDTNQHCQFKRGILFLKIYLLFIFFLIYFYAS